MTQLLHFDEYLFHLVNTGSKNLCLDWLMPLLRDKYFWAPVYVFLFSFLLLNFQKKGLLLALVLIACVGISDNVSSQVVKKRCAVPAPAKP